jgi:hypothetical protein
MKRVDEIKIDDGERPAEVAERARYKGVCHFPRPVHGPGLEIDHDAYGAAD